MRKQFCLALVAVSLCCCGTRPNSIVESNHSPSLAGVTEGQRAASRELGEIASIMREIADLRGWKLVPAVEVEDADQERLAAAMLSDIGEQMTPEEQMAQTEFLKAFGWVEPDFDFGRQVTSRFARELTGLYSISLRRILVGRGLDSASRRAVLRHEAVHAYQDARYRIGRRVKWSSARGDYVAAIHALAEGEATCIERQLRDPLKQGCLTSARTGVDTIAMAQDLEFAPPVVRELLVRDFLADPCSMDQGTRGKRA